MKYVCKNYPTDDVEIDDENVWRYIGRKQNIKSLIG